MSSASASASRRGSVKLPTGATATDAAATTPAAPTKGLNCAQRCKDNAAGVIASVLQILLVAGGFSAVTFFVLYYKIHGGTCYTGVPAAGIGLAAALGVLTLVALIDLIMEAVGGDPEKTDNVAIRAWYFMKCSLMGWGMVLAAMGWCLYELLRANMFSSMRAAGATHPCNSMLYWGVGGVVAALAVIVVFYVLLVSIILIVTCAKHCQKDKAKKEEDAAPKVGADGKPLPAKKDFMGSCWRSTLQFFKLQGLARDDSAAAAAPEPSKGKSEDKQGLIAAAAAGV